MNVAEFRNLAEQVQKNKEDILKHFQRDEVLADFGIRVIGQLATEEELEEIPTEGLQYGDAYAIGEESPFTYYIWTRANNISDVDYWFEFGEIAIVGPQGPRGPQGLQGATGESSKWYFMNDSEWNYQTTGYTDGDLVLLYPSYDVWYFDSYWRPVGSIKGAQGLQGKTGPQGPKGDTGAQGPKGDTGDVGGFINIAGILATEDQLPNPELISNLTVAYLVGSTEPYDLYIQVGSTSIQAQWLNTGPLNVATLVTVNGQYQNTWDADTKVDSIPISQVSGSLVYIRDHLGVDSYRTLSALPSGGAIPVYNRSSTNQGVLKTGTPEADNDCVNKRYFEANKGYTSLGTYTLYSDSVSLMTAFPGDYEDYSGHAILVSAKVKFTDFSTGAIRNAIFGPMVLRLPAKGMPAFTNTATCVTDSSNHSSGQLSLSVPDYSNFDYDPIPTFNYTLSNPGGSDFIDPKIEFLMQDLGAMPE